jgi:alanyl-tRNA synthetase
LRLRETAEKLSCSFEETVSAVTRTLAERDANFKSFRGMLERLAKAEAALTLQEVPGGPQGLRIVSHMFEDVPSEYLGFFATETAKSERTVALLAVADGGHLLFAQHPSSGKDMSALLKTVFVKFGGKGGGARDFARGRVNDPSQAANALTLAKELLSAG